ncbi:MAG: class I mannose-6-phosphate isomerase [Planctomycetaceae bacterium]|nr:class I mannose-6-phosphate isomerase [Planctomycetaceae bacterium]
MSLNELPPLVFRPVLKRIRWGGRKLGSLLGKAIGEESDYAESWEIADHADGMSLVADGPLAGMTLAELIKTAPVSLLGKHAALTQFPLLIKFLDANDWLSLQVHPDDARAKRYNPTENGKTEAWVILHAEPSSQICAGLRPGVTPEQLRSAAVAGQTEDLLNIYNVKAGDCIFVPAGTVHALGPGIVLAEVQQQSNLTFRLHDWGRVDANGNPRPLHLEESMACTDFERGPVQAIVPRTLAEGRVNSEELVRCPYFAIRRHTATTEVSLADRDEFRILMILSGKGRLETSTGIRAFEKGTTILIPACSKSLQVAPETSVSFLEVFGPERVN